MAHLLSPLLSIDASLVEHMKGAEVKEPTKAAKALQDNEFEKVFGMDKLKFWKQSFWKQRDAKKKAGLF